MLLVELTTHLPKVCKWDVQQHEQVVFHRGNSAGSRCPVETADCPNSSRWCYAWRWGYTLDMSDRDDGSWRPGMEAREIMLHIRISCICERIARKCRDGSPVFPFLSTCPSTLALRIKKAVGQRRGLHWGVIRGQKGGQEAPNYGTNGNNSVLGTRESSTMEDSLVPSASTCTAWSIIGLRYRI